MKHRKKKQRVRGKQMQLRSMLPSENLILSMSLRSFLNTQAYPNWRLLAMMFGLSTIFSCKNNVNPERSLVDQTRERLSAPSDSLVLKAGEGLYYYRDQPFSGVSFSYYPNGELSEKKEYDQGRKHGLIQKWFENGTLSFESRYVRGRRHGKTTTWWRNQNKRTESNYVHGVLNGLQMQWYKSGAMFKKMQLVDGREEGLQQSWRENGKLYNNYEAKNGRIFGLKRANLCYELDNELIQQYGD